MVSLRHRMDKRARSSVPQFRCRVPTKLVDQLRGKKLLLHLSRRTEPACIKIVTIGADVAFSLESTDGAIAAARHADALEHLQRLFDLTAAPPTTLTHRDMVALAGAVYHTYVWVHEDDPGEPGRWAWHKGLSRAILEGRIRDAPPATLRVDDGNAGLILFGTGDLTTTIDALPPGQHDGLERRFGLLADWALIRHRIHLASEKRKHFLKLVGAASLDASWQLRRNAEGDYRPDPMAQRFPPIESVAAVRPKQTITDLFNLWWKEAKATGRSQSTHDTYKGAIDRLIKHLGHDDANRVSEDDMLGFKGARLEVVSAKTLKDGDLPGIKAVFGWAVDNRKLTKNPADVIKMKAEKKTRTRPKGFTDQEAAAIFAACLAYERKPKEDAKTAAAKRWAPLIACYTGCRISEALQIRKEDVRKESGRHIFDFNPSAGSIKSGTYRLVPVHPHLIELGLLRFIEDTDAGPLFAKGSYKRVLDFVRTIVTDKRVQPNHGWRHRFKSTGRTLGLDPRVVDAIQGHAPRTSGDDYGDVSVVAMARVINAIPQISPPRKQDRGSKALRLAAE